MFEKYKDGDLITLKLSSGEEVIGKFVTNETPDTIAIDKALVLMQGPQGLAFGTFFSTANQEQPITLNSKNITAAAFINDKIKEEYKRIFSKVVVPEKPKIIT